MPFIATPCLILAVLAQVGPPASVEPAGRAPRHQVSLEVVPVGGALGYAHRVAPHTTVGLKVGLGLDILSPVPIAGGHFADDWGLSYETRDGNTNKSFYEVVNGALFVRHFLPRRFHVEGGLRLVGGLHVDSSDDDPGSARFLGGYAALFWGWKYLSIGTRISVGMFSESRTPGHPEREAGVLLNPIILKLTTP